MWLMTRTILHQWICGRFWIVIDIVTMCIELPVLCWAVFVLCHQVKAGYATPIYVINLLISDFVQIIGRLLWLMYSLNLFFHVLLFGALVSVGFMVCIALERYLLVVHPLWYRCRHTIKHSVLISLAVWASVVLLFTGVIFSPYIWISIIVFASILILPLPLFVFFLGATCRALSHSISVSHKEKKRILGILALVLLLYSVMFSPFILCLINDLKLFYDSAILLFVSYVSLCISPLVDTVLYILMKKDARNTVMVSHCCQRLRTHRENREPFTVQSENITSV